MKSNETEKYQDPDHWGNHYALPRLQELEARVLADAASGINSHDVAAHLSTLKLYQIYPDHEKCHIKGVILAKALMALPSEVFTCCRFLLCSLLEQTQEPREEQPELIQKLLELGEQLETGRFPQFWRLRLREGAEQTPLGQLLETVVDFDKGIRQFMVSVIELAFQKISMRSLSSLLNTSEIPRGWELLKREGQDGIVLVHPNEQELMRMKTAIAEQLFPIERLIPIFARFGRETQRSRTRRRRPIPQRRGMDQR